jgi:hypothetical protein
MAFEFVSSVEIDTAAGEAANTLHLTAAEAVRQVATARA